MTTRGKVTAADQQPGGSVVYTLGVWCEDERGEKRTVGDARVAVKAR